MGNTVYPIRDPKKLAEIFEGLERDESWHGKRMYLLFATLFFTGLRVGDVIRLEKKHVMGEAIITVEGKTGKKQHIPIPPDLRQIYDERLYGLEDRDYLFPSRKRRPDGTERHIDRRAALYDMKKIQKKFNLGFPFGCHSLRKTHGYMRYKQLGDPIEVLRLHFNHADEATTRRYIGIEEEELTRGLMKLHGGSYRPPKAEHPTKRKNVSGVELEIERQDREENGRQWGLAKQEASNRRKQKAEQEALKKKQRSEYDRDRYKRRKEQEAAEKAKQNK